MAIGDGVIGGSVIGGSSPENIVTPQDRYLSLNDLNILFQQLTLQCLGLADNAYDKVRISWQKQGAPAWKVDDDIVFIRLSEEDNPYNRQREVVMTQISEDVSMKSTSYTRVNSVAFALYGPESYENAQTLRDFFFYDDSRRTLSQSGIYMIPDVAAPRRVPESFQGQWWERIDFTLYFNELIIRNVVASSITSVDISVTTEDGVVQAQTIS